MNQSVCRRCDVGAAGVDLNTASSSELADFCGLGSSRAEQIARSRPLQDWDDVLRLDGFTRDLLRDMQHAGARIGGAAGGGDRPGREHA